MKFTKLVKATDIPENTVWDWEAYRSGQVGDFFKALAEAISIADQGNLELLRKAYPNLVSLYEKWHSK